MVPARARHGCARCPRRCGGSTGTARPRCGVERLSVAWWGLHHGEEPPISGTRGSGTIFFAGCNLGCVYCQNKQISRPHGDVPFSHPSVDELATTMLALETRGAHNVNLVTASHHVDEVAEALRLAKARGLSVPVVWNTSSYETIDALRALEGLVDVYLADLKYADPALARALSHAPDYVDVARAAVAEMYRQVGGLVTDDDGVATRGLVIRHLVLPEHLDDTRATLSWLMDRGWHHVPVALMAQYHPLAEVPGHPELSRTLTELEHELLLAIVDELGIEEGWVQELGCDTLHLPDFRREDPFVSGGGPGRP